MPAGSTVVLANGGRFLEDPACPASERIFIGGALWATCNGGGGAPYDFAQLNGLAEELEAPGAFTASVSSNSICFEEELDLFASTSVSGATLSWSGSGPGGYVYTSASANPTIVANTFTVAGVYTFVARVTNTLGFYEEQSFTVNVIESCDVPVINSPDYVFICNNSSRTLTANFGEPVISYQWFRNNQPISGANSNSLTINKWSLGKYFVQAETSGGATLLSQIINVNRFDIVDATNTNQWAYKNCPDTELEFFGPVMNNVSYAWTIGSLNSPTIETSREYNATYTGGTYNLWLKVTTQGGCLKYNKVSLIPESEKNCEVVEDPVRPSEEVSAKTAAEFFGNDVALTFYPNPVRGNYKINLSGLAQDETFNISWFDLTGKQVLATAISTGTGTVVENSINNLSKGMYLVQVNNANHNFTFKVMVD